MTGLFGRIQQDLEQRERMEGISPVDLLDMPDDLRGLVLLLSRRGELPLDELCQQSGLSQEEARELLDTLEEKGYVLRRDIKGVDHYRTYFGRRRRREVPIDIWSSLAERTEGEPEADGEDGEGEEGGDGGTGGEDES